MAYTKAEAVEAIYNEFADVPVPFGAPEDFVEWAVEQRYALDADIVRLFEQSADGVFDSLESYAAARFPGCDWELLVDVGYWQGDQSDMVFTPMTEVG